MQGVWSKRKYGETRYTSISSQRNLLRNHVIKIANKPPENVAKFKHLKPRWEIKFCIKEN